MTRWVCCWDRLDRHGVRYHVLEHVADRCQDNAEHIPGLDRHHSTHAFGMRDQPEHDEQARGNHQCTEIDEVGLISPK